MVCEGKSIGHKRNQKFSPVKTKELRVVVTKAVDMCCLAVYQVCRWLNCSFVVTFLCFSGG